MTERVQSAACLLASGVSCEPYPDHPSIGYVCGVFGDYLYDQRHIRRERRGYRLQYRLSDEPSPGGNDRPTDRRCSPGRTGAQSAPKPDRTGVIDVGILDGAWRNAFGWANSRRDGRRVYAPQLQLGRALGGER